MLVQFSVENFLSFDEEQIFSMVASKDDLHPKHVVPNGLRKGASVLRGAAIYGANAAGKSNLVEAIRFAQQLILGGTRGRQSIPSRPFRLKTSPEDTSSKFEFVIQTGGILYNYGLRVDSSRVREEWLFATPKTQEVLFFQRTTNEAGKVEVEFGPSFTGRSSENKQFLKFVAQGTRPNQPFLTETLERNVEACAPIVEWFQNICLIISAEAESRDIEGRAHFDKSFFEFLSGAIRAAGTGIEEVETEIVPFDFQTYVPEMPEAQRAEITDTVAGMGNNMVTRIRSTTGERYMLTRGAGGEPMLVRLHMIHTGIDGNSARFQLHEESDGTQRFIHLLPALFALRNNPETVVIIDELDRRLHPMLSHFFVQAALDSDDQTRQSQLIFTTHDTNLLDQSLLRRDEVWFVEKDRGGASHLYSLAEFKIRPDLKIEKGYLNGRFGAIPFLGDISHLGTSQKDEEGSGAVSQAA